jgi:hypothetical protein
MGLFDRLRRKKPSEETTSGAGSEAGPDMASDDRAERRARLQAKLGDRRAAENRAKQIAELEANPRGGPPCSECGRTSDELMVGYLETETRDVKIFDSSWVGTCPECGTAFCIHHSIRVPDEVYGDDVPGCPNHEKQLSFG